jgi:hypothetical protein
LLAIAAKLVEIFRTNAANEHAGGILCRRGQRRTVDHGNGKPYARHLADALGDILPIRQRRFERLHQKVTVQADDLVHQLLSEAVHDGHHDDQRRNAEHDAEEREAGNDGDEAFLATRPQVAPGQQPFECRKRQGARDLLHGVTLARFRYDSSARFGEQSSSTAIFPPCLTPQPATPEEFSSAVFPDPWDEISDAAAD